MAKILNKLLILIGLVVWLGAGGRAWAQTADPKEETVSVTATVPSQEPPPAPILISPPNNSILTSGVVTFVWRAVTDHIVDIDRYQLHLNGVIYFGNISTSAQETDDYTLTFDGENYSLKLKADKYLADGTYTWKIRVVDVNNKGTDSTTWTFTVDTQAPPLVITNIDGQETAISASDPSTIPSEPVQVSRSNPVIIGHTEAGSQVQLVVTFVDGSSSVYNVSADVNGIFGFHLVGLPANQIVTLTFTSIDKAGLATVLHGIQLVYQPRVIIIPIPPIIPGLPPEIEIPLPPLPTLPPTYPTPFPPLEPPEPTQPPVRVVEIPVFDSFPWLMLLLLVVALYLWLLFFLTGNGIGWLLAFLSAYWRFLFLPWLEPPHEVREQDQRRGLPWCGFALLWLDDKRRMHTKKLITDWQGRWNAPWQRSRMYQVVLHSKSFEYPADRINLSEVRPVNQPRQLYLAGESFWLFDPAQSETKTAVEFFAIPLKLVFRFVVWAKRIHPGKAKFWLYLPRIVLLVALAISAWILYNVPLWWSVVLFVLLAWMLLRDLWAKLPHRLEVYGS